ncbi:MAG: HsdM family class I SAM-dependent methyltransferase [Halanaerobiales bacterium]
MEEILSNVKQTVLDKGFNQKLDENVLDSGVIELVYSDGGEKHIYCRVYPEGYDWGPAIKETTITEAMLQENYSAFAWATNGDSNYYIDMNEEKSISHIPDVSEIEEKKEQQLDAREKWSNRMYQRLQEKFDDLHETIYASRDHVNNTNDAIDEFCKLIYMEVFRLNHPDYRLTTGKTIDEVFNHERIDAIIESIEELDDSAKLKVKQQELKGAIEDIREAFKEVKNHPDYKAAGEYPIFDKDEYIKLENPELYQKVLDTLQNLGEFETEDGTRKTGTLRDVLGDVLGRVFDVMLRGKFENKGGMGIYLTPRQVTEAMVDIAFHDLQYSGKIHEKDAYGNPTLKVGDPACGSAGFLVKALDRVEKYMSELGGMVIHEKKEFLNKLKENSFVGADNSPGMVLKARINMALHGSPKAQIFKVRDSLTSDHLQPETFDLILTNPPFGKGKYKKKTKEGKKILEHFSTDIIDGICQMDGDKLALGSKKYSNGKWRLSSSVDPAVLFIDRCLQLLKPGGYLCIVLPDGVLSNSSDQYVREYLMGKKNETTGEFEGGKVIIKGVVSLPQETFGLSGAGAKTSFLYLKKKEHTGEKQGPIFMAVADEVGFEVKNKVEIDLGDDHNDLLEIIEGYKESN